MVRDLMYELKLVNYVYVYLSVKPNNNNIDRYTNMVYYKNDRYLQRYIFRKSKKDLKKVPPFIAIKLQAWIDIIGPDGIREARKIKGYHDEPLKGNRRGQRSIRLNQAYRAIYIEKNAEIDFIEVQEVNKREY